MSTQELQAYRRFERNVVGILALMFIVSGLVKILGPVMLTQTFAEWGYPAGLAYLIGSFEIAGGALLLGQRSCFYGATLLGLVMFGAFLTHIVHGESLQAVVPLFLMTVLFMLARLHGERVIVQMARLLRWYELDALDALDQREGSYQH